MKYELAPKAYDSSLAQLNTKIEEVGNGVMGGDRFFVFFTKATLWGIITIFLAKEFASSKFWVVVFGVLIFSFPIVLCGVYGSTIRQIQRLHMFYKHGWIFRLLSGRALKIIIWTSWALGSSFFVLIQFHTYGGLEWIMFFFVVPIFWIFFSVIRRLIEKELKSYIVTEKALEWSRLACPIAMVCLYLVIAALVGNTPTYSSLEEAIRVQDAKVADMTGSALVREVSHILALYDGIINYGMGHLQNWGVLWIILFVFGNFVVFYNASAILSCFLIPRTEYRRIFGPITDLAIPPPLKKNRIAAIAAIFTFIIIVIYIPTFVAIEAWLQQSQFSEHRQNLESTILTRLEQIGDEYFNEGTIEKLEYAKLEALHSSELALALLEGQVDRAFDRLEANVDVFLDWYYSLVGEYSRIANIMIGDLEQYMVNKLQGTLQKGDPFKEFQNALGIETANIEKARKAYQLAAQKIMDENRVIPGGTSFKVTKKMEFKDVINPPVHQDFISLQGRMMAGGGAGVAAGAITAVVVKKVIGKVVGKNIIKIAAKMLSKVIVSKVSGSTGGAAAGAAAGAAIGSIVPGFGTAAGAVIGGIIGGVVVAVSVDKIFIELEEAISREDFKHKLISAIEEARADFKAKIKSGK